MKSYDESLNNEQLQLLFQILSNPYYKNSYTLKPSLNLSEDFIFGFELEAAGTHLAKLQNAFENIKPLLHNSGYSVVEEVSISDDYNEYGRTR